MSEPTEGWLKLPGLNMHYLDWGGAGTPVVALHGLASSSHWYDLVIPSEYYQSELLQPLLDLIKSDDFKSEVESLGGYDTSQTGTVLAKHSPGT